MESLSVEVRRSSKVFKAEASWLFLSAGFSPHSPASHAFYASKVSPATGLQKLTFPLLVIIFFFFFPAHACRNTRWIYSGPWNLESTSQTMSQESRNKHLTCADIDSMLLPRHQAFATFAMSWRPLIGRASSNMHTWEMVGRGISLGISLEDRWRGGKKGKALITQRSVGLYCTGGGGRWTLEGLYVMQGEQGRDMHKVGGWLPWISDEDIPPHLRVLHSQILFALARVNIKESGAPRLHWLLIYGTTRFPEPNHSKPLTTHIPPPVTPWLLFK